MNKKDGTTKSVKEIIAEGYRGNTEVSKQVVEVPEHTTEISKQVVEVSIQTEEVPTIEEPQKQIMEVSKEVEEASKQTLEISELEGMESQQTERVQAQTGKAVEVENNMKVITEKEREDNEDEIEEGELVTDWANVTPGKASRSPKATLKYGQVRIATPSRYSALNDIDDNRELLSQGKEINAVDKGMETQEVEENIDIASLVEVETTVNAVERKEETVSVKQDEVTTAVGGSSMQGTTLLLSLPRVSKTNHRVIPEISGKDSEPPSHLGKRSTRKSSQ
ncbi:uncharacterized protein LOC106416948 [Brassica napus]|nr:uncharacterized protein LOC106416948 [Brassica napus]